MPIPTEMHVSIGHVIAITVRLDTAKGKGIPNLSIRGVRDGERTDIATARLDSGSGVWDVVLPSGANLQMRYPVLDVEGPSTERAYWSAVRRVVDLFATDVLKDTAHAVGIWV